MTLLACGKREPTPEFDLSLITVEGAHMRTDTVGVGKHESTATFVLVDARNNGTVGAYVTLDGELVDANGASITELLPHVLWVPGGESRTFALVDKAKLPRPTAKSARARVRKAMILPAPLAHIEDMHSFVDANGQLIVQAYLVNDGSRGGQILVTGVFHDEKNRPMTRPFYIVKILEKQDPHIVGECPETTSQNVAQASKCPVQMVGPVGAKRGTIFVGDTMY